VRKGVKGCFQGLQLGRVLPLENGETRWKDGERPSARTARPEELWDGLASVLCGHGWVNKRLNSSKVGKYCPVCTSIL